MMNLLAVSCQMMNGPAVFLQMLNAVQTISTVARKAPPATLLASHVALTMVISPSLLYVPNLALH